VILPPYNGVVTRVFVKVGDRVRVGEPIVTVAPAGNEKEDVFPMRAPLSGTVVQVNRREGEPVRDNNDRDFLIRIDDLSRLQISASVAELDVTKLKLGMPAIARPSALIGVTSPARIREISLAPRDQDQWGNRSQQVEYEVLADLLEPSPDIKSGMSVLLDLIPLRVENTLLIGHEFLDRDEEGSFVRLKSGEIKRVEVGLANEQFAEIKSGVSEGDELQMVDFYDLSGSAPGGR
jgi:macrolide-specific efflux system membrane fusion protein